MAQVHTNQMQATPAIYVSLVAIRAIPRSVKAKFELSTRAWIAVQAQDCYQHAPGQL